MAYQKVGGTPRFYIDLLSHNQFIGNIDRIRLRDDSGDTTYANTEDGDDFLFDFINLEPEIINPIELLEENGLDNCRIGISFKNDITTYYDRGFWGSLNHNHKSTDTYFWTRNIFVDPSTTGSGSWFIDREDTINGDVVDGYGRASDGYIGNIKDGFSIMTGKMNDAGDVIGEVEVRFELNNPTDGNKTINIGSFIWGTYYDMPVNPDLDLSMSIEYDGFTNIKTLNGSTITQANYQGSPWWYDKDGNKVEPWSVGSNDISKELSDGNPFYDGEKITNNVPNKRNGRRVWKLKFSYMSDKDLFASNYGNSAYMETNTDYDSADLDTDTDNNNIFYYNIDNDDSFSAQVLNKISHGEKFIFQPDNTANNPSDFAIAVLDGDSFSMKRTAWNVYDIEMTIREVW